jgi:hypothetical protein
MIKGRSVLLFRFNFIKLLYPPMYSVMIIRDAIGLLTVLDS